MTGWSCLTQERPPSGRLSSLEGAPRASAEGPLTRYKTLPPIQVPSADEELAMKKAEKKKNSQLWVKPSPPRPFLLHLGLTSRTHDIAHFQENFATDYPHFYIDRSAYCSGLGSVCIGRKAFWVCLHVTMCVCACVFVRACACVRGCERSRVCVCVYLR